MRVHCSFRKNYRLHVHEQTIFYVREWYYLYFNFLNYSIENDCSLMYLNIFLWSVASKVRWTMLFDVCVFSKLISWSGSITWLQVPSRNYNYEKVMSSLHDIVSPIGNFRCYFLFSHTIIMTSYPKRRNVIIRPTTRRCNLDQMYCGVFRMFGRDGLNVNLYYYVTTELWNEYLISLT